MSTKTSNVAALTRVAITNDLTGRCQQRSTVTGFEEMPHHRHRHSPGNAPAPRGSSSNVVVEAEKVVRINTLLQCKEAGEVLITVGKADPLLWFIWGGVVEVTALIRDA